MKQWANRVDANQQQIIQCLQQIGCSVQKLNKVGCGCPDIMVGCKNSMGIPVNYVMEIKTLKPFGKLNETQQHWHNDWKGQKAIVRSISDALAVIGL